MRLALYKAPLVLMLYQVAPVQARTDSTGALHLKFGYGGGQFEHASYGCNGQLLGASAIPFSTLGGAAEYWDASNNLRVSASGGVASINTDLGAQTSKRSMEAFGGVQVAREGRRFGAGIGIVRMPFAEPGKQPGIHLSPYMRIGNRDGGHFRIDSYYPSFAPGATGDAFRIGVGMNRTARAGASGFFGFSTTPYGGEGKALGLFAELDVPVASRAAVSIMASARTSEEHRDASGGVGFRYTFGRRPPP